MNPNSNAKHRTVPPELQKLCDGFHAKKNNFEFKIAFELEFHFDLKCEVKLEFAFKLKFA